MIDFYSKEKMQEMRKSMYANPPGILKLSAAAKECNYSTEGFNYAWFRVFGTTYCDDQDAARAAYIERGLKIGKSMKKISKELGLTDITCARIYQRVQTEKGNVKNGKQERTEETV